MPCWAADADASGSSRVISAPSPDGSRGRHRLPMNPSWINRDLLARPESCRNLVFLANTLLTRGPPMSTVNIELPESLLLSTG